MKRFLLTMMTLVALVLVANTTFAQTNTTPYQGSSYNYTLSSVTLTGAGTGKIILTSNGNGITPDLAISSNWSVTSATDQSAGSLSPSANTNYYDLTLAQTVTEINFTILYDASLAAANYDLYVEVTQGGCSNYIRLDVAVTAAPSIDLALTASGATVCQTTDTDAANITNNTPASAGQTTTWTYTVTPDDLTNVANYGFTFQLANYTLGANSITVSSGDATLDTNTGLITVTAATGNVTLTASVSTTTGQSALDVAGTIASCSFTLTSGAGGGTYSGTQTDDTEAVSISTLPGLGSF